jgi:non-heme chloroperoxidase
VALLDQPPVLIGHSMGALVVQRYLESASVPAAVHLCPVPPYGLMPATFSLAFARPVLFHEIHALASGHSASREALADALFAGPLDEARVERYYGRMQAESRRALFDMSGWGLPQPWRANRPATLVLGASRDALIPAPMAQSAALMLRAEYRSLDGLGHAVMLESDWRRSAGNPRLARHARALALPAQASAGGYLPAYSRIYRWMLASTIGCF